MIVKNYFQKSNFGQEEKAEVQNENFHHVILSVLSCPVIIED